MANNGYMSDCDCMTETSRTTHLLFEHAVPICFDTQQHLLHVLQLLLQLHAAGLCSSQAADQCCE